MDAILRTLRHQHNFLWTDEVCFTRDGVFKVLGTFGHGTIFVVSTNVALKFAAASVFGPVPSGTLPWAPVGYLTSSLLDDIVNFWKMFYRGCLQIYP
jgi:hypothetical protein